LSFLNKRISTIKTAKEWKKAEQNCGLRYNGQSKQTQRFQWEKAWEKAEEDKITRKRQAVVCVNEILSHKENSQGATMRYAFLNKPKAVKEVMLAHPTGGLRVWHFQEGTHSTSKSEASLALPHKDLDTGSVITDKIFTGYISNGKEDMDEEMEGTHQVGVGDAMDHADKEGPGVVFGSLVT